MGIGGHEFCVCVVLIVVRFYRKESFDRELPFHMILILLQGASHLLTSIEMYCKEAISSYPPYESPHLDDSSNDLETPPEYENMELENLVFDKVTEEIEARQRSGGSVSFHLHAPKALIGLVEGINAKRHPLEAHREAMTSYKPL